MRISRALSVFTHLIALTGFLSVFISGGASAPAAAVFCLALLISFAGDLYNKPYHLSDRVSALLAVLLVGYCASGIFIFGFETFRVILDFLIYTQVLKLLGKKRMRDIVQIYLLSFFQFLAGTITTISFSFAAAFIIYIAVAIGALMVFEMRKGSLDSGGRGESDPGVVTPLFLSTTLLVGLCIFLLAALIFVTVPRLKGSYLRADFLRTSELRSGFSDEVMLGRVGEIKLDSSPVMMVRVLDRDVRTLREPVYWRGIALDEFDGRTWRATEGGYGLLREDADDVIKVGPAPDDTFAQEIITESLDTDVLFAADAPASFRSVPGGRIAEINDSYILPGRIAGRMKYYAYSDVSRPSAEELRSAPADYSDIDAARFLTLPPLGPEVRKLAADITSYDATVYDKTLSVKRYLLSNYAYTRTLKEGSGEYPLEEFLFGGREGHCEYFSTAMVVLLREAGIPARVVNGFIGGEWNPHGKFFLIRESDAHSWVEVYFPGRGWVTFDPTPESGDPGGVSAFSFVASYVDYLRFRWNRYVIDFSRRDQARLLSEVRDSWSWQAKKLTGPSGAPPRPDAGTLAALVAAVLVLWVFITKPGIRLLIPGRSSPPSSRASEVYKKALAHLSKKGFPRPGHMTPREFSRHLKRSSYPGWRTMDELTDKYMRLRFGDVRGPLDTDEEDLRLLGRLYRDLKAQKPARR